MIKYVTITEVRKRTIEVEVYADEDAPCVDDLAISKAEDCYYPGLLDDDYIRLIDFEVEKC